MGIRKLYRSKDGVFLGVLGGLADYFGWNRTILRWLFAIGVLFSGLFPLVVGYVIFALIVPKTLTSEPPRGSYANNSAEQMAADAEELRKKTAAQDVERDWEKRFHK